MKRTNRVRVLAGLGSVVLLSALAACGGDGGGSTSSSPDDPVEGTLRTFTYDDSIDPEIIDPFEEQYPDLKVETATFNSNAQAAA
jgi:spermidine/putrescine transport system substrate-binding protein